MSYRDKPNVFRQRQERLSEVLVFIGMCVNDERKLKKSVAAAMLSEAAQRVNSLRAELRRRGTHPRFLASCGDEVLAENAFHASPEATKGVAQHLRDRTGATEDGGKLVDATLALGRSG